MIWVDVDPAIATDRGVHRDADRLGGLEAARAAYARRYLAACVLYVAEEDPSGRASIVVQQDDPLRPVIARLG